MASVTLSDDVGATTSASASAVAVASGLTVRATVLPSGGDVGIALSFRAVGTGGTAPLSFAWQFGDGSTSTGATPTHAYPSAGTDRVNLTATDALGAVATASLSVVVASDPTATISAAPSAPGASSDRLSANVSGGTAPFNYTWLFGDSTESGLPSPVHQYADSGELHSPAMGERLGRGSVHRSMTVSGSGASSSPSTTSSSGGSGTPLWFWLGLAILLIAGAVGAIVLGRRTRPAEPRDQGPSPPTGA